MPARAVLMVEPIGFGPNPQTADDNAFQAPASGAARQDLESAARDEYVRLRDALRASGVEVVEWAAQANRETPDAVFPNNWFSTRADGTLVLYPMKAANRRSERRPEIVAALADRYPDVVDLTEAEDDDRFLEGTGSLVVDDRAAIVYASESPRTDRRLAESWAERFEYEPVIFRATDAAGRPIYHTNVLLAVGERWAVICARAVDPLDRSEILATLAETGHETIDISREQMGDFCGNVIELESTGGERLIVMSDRALAAFDEAQRAVLEKHGTIVHSDLTTIERHGGGSARCMIAELH